MQRSSTARIFKDISYNGIRKLAKVLDSATLSTISNIRQQYNDEAVWFSEHLALLRNLKVIDLQDDKVAITANKFVENAINNGNGQWILPYLLKNEGDYASELLNFWIFYIDKSNFEYSQEKHLPSSTADTRDFLIHIGALNALTRPGHYRLASFSKAAYLNRSYSKGKAFSPESLALQLENNKRIGEAAEHFALEYEERRLGKEVFREQVKYVAREDTSAGFDIQSVTLFEKSEIPRYIEVKAVPFDTKRFFFSAGELKVAELYCELYYLYLIPIVEEQPSLDDLQIIQDPFQYFFSQKKESWSIEPNSYRIQKKL
ncbi:MAG: DUF3883 domain-containing protein [Mariniblastus sp.]|nr:DUF3883 domain-containing protein [Mariniblastus sp.]